MSNSEMYIVAKPHFETSASGQSEISIVDVWIVPDNGREPVPSLIDDRRGGMPRQHDRCPCVQRDQSRFYQPGTAASLQPYQHMILYRTREGWQVQYDFDPRLNQYGIDPSMQRRTAQQPPYSVDPRGRYQSLDPRVPYQVDPRGQYCLSYDYHSGVDPRISQSDYQRHMQVEAQRQNQAEITRRYQIEMQRRYQEMQWQQEQARYRSAPQARLQGSPQWGSSTGSRATYGVDPNTGVLLDRRNQNDRQQIEHGYPAPQGQYVQQGRARFGVDPRSGVLLDQRNQNDRQQIEHGYPQQSYRPYQPSPGPTDSTRWTANQRNTRSWNNNLDFDRDGTAVRNSVGTYLDRYGPDRRPNPSGQYAPNPFTPQGIISNGIDSSLRSLGDYLRGR